jgi:protein TonB
MGIHLVPTDSTDQKVYTKVDQPAYPIGGSHKMYMSFIHKIKSYPRPGKKYKLLVISFTVEKDGNLTDFRVVKSGGKKYDTEAMNQMPHLPKFIPAIHQGKKVRSLSSIQIRYQKQ